MIVVGVADPDASIRKTVIAAFDPKFDPYLAHPNNIRTLFLALNDESVKVRELVITIVGRLALRNPSQMMPNLRKIVIRVLGNLHFSSDTKTHEQSCRLLSHLIHASHRLIEPYVSTILNVLLPFIKDSRQVSLDVMIALGALSRAGGPELRLYFDQLMPPILENLQNQSSSFRRITALKTLRQLASNTGVVISPYYKHPELFQILVNGLKTETSPPIRKELLRCFATLGALDPYKWKIIEQKHKGNLGETEDISLATGLTKKEFHVPITAEYQREGTNDLNIFICL